MLFKKYHILILRDREGGSSQLRLRGWVGVFLFLLLVGFAASTIYLWGFHYRSQILEKQLTGAEKTIKEQNTQIASMDGKLRLLQGDLARIQQFDAKLRVMMNMDKDPADISGNLGGPLLAASSQPLPLYRQELVARRVHSLLDQLSTDARMEELRQQDLLHAMRANREVLASTPSIWPTDGYLTSTFGRRASPFGAGTSDFHKGIDIANRPGTPVRATAQGIVTFAGWDGGYGNCVVINHGNNISTRYGHLQQISAKLGQATNRGDVIGTVGSSGRSTGPHLHYEVRVGGVSVNPLRYILN
ncbi:MAG: M23 family metallopeptidase [Deltaproteobacteria bacterium]|jgi:murein DD-endopeptidase MepM/ murein hydrolase activator NlpD|nr:M23 family metallopeptidase [Deltaproteobacteria bacterium]